MWGGIIEGRYCFRAASTHRLFPLELTASKALLATCIYNVGHLADNGGHFRDSLTVVKKAFTIHRRLPAT